MLNYFRLVRAWLAKNSGLIDRLSKVFTAAGLIVGVASYLLESGDRTKLKHYQAWQVISLASLTKKGDQGRRDSIRDLVHDDMQMQGINLQDADLHGLELNGGYFFNASFDKAHLTMAKFNCTSAHFFILGYRIPFFGAPLCSNLVSAHFAGLPLSGTEFKGASLKGATFSRTSLVGVDFSAADLSNATFDHVQITGNFQNSVMHNTVFDQVIIFSPTNFSNAIISDVDLSQSVFDKKIFSGAVLCRVKFPGGKLDQSGC